MDMKKVSWFCNAIASSNFCVSLCFAAEQNVTPIFGGFSVQTWRENLQVKAKQHVQQLRTKKEAGAHDAKNRADAEREKKKEEENTSEVTSSKEEEKKIKEKNKKDEEDSSDSSRNLRKSCLKDYSSISGKCVLH